VKALYLLRHAKAAPHAAPADGDRERPLTERGQRAMRIIGAWATEHRLAPELVLCSAARRTRQTLDLLLPVLGRAPQILYEDDLYLAEPRELQERLHEVPATTASVLLIGHNPGIHDLAMLLADSSSGPLARRLADGFPTAAFAGFEMSGSWAGLGRERARLTAFVTPRDLARGRD
jgi:phosphohistidine phosphatase